MFFALLFHWLWPLLYILHLFSLYELPENLLSTVELLLGTLLSGCVLPVAVLVPVLLEVSLSRQEHAMLLFNILVLPSLWLPLGLSLLQTPLVLEARGDSNEDAFRASFDRADGLRAEMRRSFLGYLLFMGVPLGALLPIYVRAAGDAEADAVIMFFLLLVGSAAALALVGPRLGLLASNALYPPESRDHGGRTALRALTEMLLSGVVLPVFVMLPVLLEVELPREPHAVLTAFIIGLPCLALFRMLYVAFEDSKDALLWSFGIAAAVLVLPLGVLLPSWIATASHISAAGQVVFLVFMLGPLVVALALLNYYTASSMPNLPFSLLSHVRHPVPRWLEVLWGALLLLVPVIVLLPIRFEAVLTEEAEWALVAFLLIVIALLVVLFAVSCCVRNPSDMMAPSKHRAAALAASGRPPSGSISGPMEFRGPADPNFDANDLGSRHNTADSVALGASSKEARAAALAAKADPTNAYAANGAAPTSPRPAHRAVAPSRSNTASVRGTSMPGHRVPTGLTAGSWLSRRSSFSSPPPSPPPPPPPALEDDDEPRGFADSPAVGAAFPAPTDSTSDEYETAALPPRDGDGPWEVVACYQLDTSRAALATRDGTLLRVAVFFFFLTSFLPTAFRRTWWAALSLFIKKKIFTLRISLSLFPPSPSLSPLFPRFPPSPPRFPPYPPPSPSLPLQTTNSWPLATRTRPERARTTRAT